MSLRPLVIADAVLGAGLFTFAWIRADANEGAGSVIGAIGWFGFWACVLVMASLGVVALVRRIRRSATA